MRSCLFKILLCVGLFPTLASGQDYFAYQKIWNRVDDDMTQGKPVLARLDTIYNGYSFIYARHCLKGLQVAIVAGDSIRACQWLTKAFLQGIPLWMIRANSLANKALFYNNVKTVLQQYDSLRSHYFTSIDMNIAGRIDSLLAKDQSLTDKVNNGFILARAWNDIFRWRKNNKHSFEVIRAITYKYGFPGEQLIGLPPDLQDSAKAYKFFLRYGAGTVKDHRAYTMLIHYFSNKRPDIDSVWYINVTNGYLAAYQFGALNDFRSRYGNADTYYNVWHTAKDKTYKIDEVNMRRQVIGLNSYEQQQHNRQISRQRLKNKTSGNKVMPE